jgi:hypothetical protein
MSGEEDMLLHREGMGGIDEDTPQACAARQGHFHLLLVVRRFQAQKESYFHE